MEEGRGQRAGEPGDRRGDRTFVGWAVDWPSPDRVAIQSDSFTVSGGVATQQEILLNGKYGRLRTARLGPDGSLYLTTSIGSGDRVIRLTPTLQ